MQTIKITKELKEFAKSIYDVNLKEHLESIRSKINTLILNKEYNEANQIAILKYLYSNIASILLYTPNEMNELFNKHGKYYQRLFYVKEGIGGDRRRTTTDFSKTIQTILNYDKFRKEIGPKLVREVGIKTCPYCNSQLTIAFDKEDNEYGKANLQLDHFYPKSKFPYFSISFFNLIPSCSNCNLAKGDQDYSYENDFHLYSEDKLPCLFKFEIEKISKVEFLLSKDPKDLKINFIGDVHSGKFVKHHNDKFDIEGIYSTQKDLVEELIQKKKIYNNDYKSDLKDILGREGFTNASIDRLILGNYHLEDDIHKRPMAKFTQDIAKDIGLI